MATIDNKEIIDAIIAADGYYEDDPRVDRIVEYTNAYGNVTWGVVWSNEHPRARERYNIATDFVQRPKTIWQAK